MGYSFGVAPVAQLAEATDSKPVQCEFESHLGHNIGGGFRKTFSGAPAKLFFSKKRDNLLAKYASLNVKRPEVGQSRPNSGRFSLFEHDF